MAPLWHALRAEELKALGTKSPRFVDDFVTRSELQVLPGSKGLSYERGSIREAAAGGDGDGASGAPDRRGERGQPAAGSLGGTSARVLAAVCARGKRAACRTAAATGGRADWYCGRSCGAADRTGVHPGTGATACLGWIHAILDDAGCSPAGVQLCDCAGGQRAVQPRACGAVASAGYSELAEAAGSHHVWWLVQLSAFYRFAPGV